MTRSIIPCENTQGLPCEKREGSGRRIKYFAKSKDKECGVS